MTIAGVEQIAQVRRLNLSATQQLLGDTITISDADWTTPTALSGWTRAHVATHLARNADVIREVVSAAVSGRPAPIPLGPVQEMRMLEAGSRRSSLDLQIDLDTSFSRLNVTFDQLTPEQWDATVSSPWGDHALTAMPVIRLLEVVLHHVDLDCGYTFAGVDPAAAELLLEWVCERRAPEFGPPSVHIESAHGYSVTLGNTEAEPVQVIGTATNLLGWLTGRLDRTAVVGAEHLSLGIPR